MGLFDFVKKDDRFRLPVDLVNQRVGFAVSDISRVGAKEALLARFTAVLAHVKPDEIAVECLVCNDLCRFGLADTCWPGKEINPKRTVLPSQAVLRPGHGTGHCFSGSTLADDAFLKLFRQLLQPDAVWNDVFHSGRLARFSFDGLEDVLQANLASVASGLTVHAGLPFR